MKLITRDKYDPLPDDPSLRPIPCVICGTLTPLGETHSIAVVYVGCDAFGAWRHTICDADQPFACCQEHAVQAAIAYHAAHGPHVRGDWQDTDPMVHSAGYTGPIPFHQETACHGCGKARDATHSVVLCDYRCTGHPAVSNWDCPHVLCPACLPESVTRCTQEHLLAEHQRRRVQAVKDGRFYALHQGA